MSLRRFGTHTKMCEVQDQGKLQTIPIIWKAKNRNSSNNSNTSVTNTKNLSPCFYNGTISQNNARGFCRNVSNWDFQKRWKGGMAKTKYLYFVGLSLALSTPKNQIYSNYQGDRYPVDRLLTAVNIPTIQASLKGRIPSTSKTAIHLIYNRFSDKDRTSGAISVHISG